MRVGVGAIGDAGGVAHQRDARSVELDRRFAGADVAAVVALGRRGGEQPFVSGDVAQELELPGVVLVMADEAGDLDLMHREDHAGRAAGRAEDRADVGDIGRARAVAAELASGSACRADAARGSPRTPRRESGPRGRRRRRMFGDGGGLFGALDEIAGFDGFAGAGAAVDVGVKYGRIRTLRIPLGHVRRRLRAERLSTLHAVGSNRYAQNRDEYCDAF